MINIPQLENVKSIAYNQPIIDVHRLINSVKRVFTVLCTSLLEKKSKSPIAGCFCDHSSGSYLTSRMKILNSYIIYYGLE
jgi:hypothetical protein